MGDAGSTTDRPRLRRGRLLRRAATTVGALAVVNLVWLLWAAVDEGAVPGASALPEAPAGVTVLERDVACGSGGCWRELVLDAGDRSAADLRGELGLEHQRCRPSLPVPRKVCTDASVGADDRLVVVARYAW